MNNDKKMDKIVYVFFFLYLILPDYFAIEISNKLPLLTIKRLLLIILIGTYIIKNNGKINLRVFYNKNMGISTKLYFIFIILANLAFITSSTDSIKQLFSIVLEELLLIWIIVKNIDTKEKIIKCFDIIIIGSGVAAVISIINLAIGNNLFYILNTVDRKMLMANYTRMNLVRAEAGFGHPVYYGAYNTVLIPILLYFIENKNQNIKYKIILILDILALFLSNSRGSIIVFGIMLVYMLLKNNLSVLKKYLSLGILVLIGALFVIIVNPNTLKYAKSIGGSIVNVFVDNKSEIKDYGKNESGLKSRTSQLSQVKWTVKENSLFGLGAGAQNRDKLKYLASDGKWHTSTSFDIGYISIICQYGIIGSIAFLCLYSTIIKNTLLNKKEKKDKIIRLFKNCFITYFLCMLSMSGVNNLFWILFGLLISYTNILCNYSKENRMLGEEK